MPITAWSDDAAPINDPSIGASFIDTSNTGPSAHGVMNGLSIGSSEAGT